jgi:hypothetical protein
MLTAEPDEHTGRYASKLNFVLNSDDFSYSIVTHNSKGKVVYLTDHENQSVSFESIDTPKGRWIPKFDKKSQAFFIVNKLSRLHLNVDVKKNYVVSTLRQTEDSKSLFTFERPTYKQYGCWKNKIGHQLELYLGAHRNLNVDLCSELCAAKAKKTGKTFKYFGLSEQKQCFCGNNFANAQTDKAADSDCSDVCPGRGGEACGGKFRTSMFKITSDKKNIVVGAKKSTSVKKSTGRKILMKPTELKNLQEHGSDVDHFTDTVVQEDWNKQQRAVLDGVHEKMNLAL